MDQYRKDASYKKRCCLRKNVAFVVVSVIVLILILSVAWQFLKMYNQINLLQVQNIEMMRRLDDLSLQYHVLNETLTSQSDHQMLVDDKQKRRLDSLSSQVYMLNQTLTRQSEHQMHVDDKQKRRLDSLSSQVHVLNQTFKSLSDHQIHEEDRQKRNLSSQVRVLNETLKSLSDKQKKRLDNLSSQVRVLNKTQSDNLIHVEMKLKEHITEDEATLQNYNSYLLNLSRNLTQIRSEYAASVVLGQERMKHDEKSSQKLKYLDEHLQDVKKAIDHLDSEIHQPVGIYKHCLTSEDSCTAGTEGNGRYWKACHSMSFPKEKMVIMKL